MHIFKFTLAAIALLLASCTSLATQRPTPTPTTAAGSTVVTETLTPDTSSKDTLTNTATGPISETASGTTTPVVVVGSTAEDAPTTEPVTNTIPNTATNQSAATEASVATTASITTEATTPAAVAVAQAQAIGQAQATAQGEAYDNAGSPVDVIASFYNAITRQEYERAFAYWQEAPLDYESFASGYADTASVQVIVQPPTRIEGAAGSLYAEVPVFLVASHHDGSVLSFTGCIVTRRSNIEPPESPESAWMLYQARLTQVDNNANIPALLASGCAQ